MLGFVFFVFFCFFWGGGDGGERGVRGGSSLKRGGGRIEEGVREVVG